MYIKLFPTWSPSVEKHRAGAGRYASSNLNRAVYNNNREIFRRFGYETESGHMVALQIVDPMLSGTRVYDTEIPEVQFPELTSATKTGVENCDSMIMTRKMMDWGLNPAVLNLASAYHACGGYNRGSNAQEESLCRVSTLSQSLYQYFDAESAAENSVSFIRKAYPLHIRYGGIYSPGVTVFRDISNGFALLEEPFTVSVISVAALNFRETNRYANENLKYKTADGGFTPDGRAIMLDKIHTIFRIALTNGHDSLVLGAFGCGAYHLRPDLVAPLFRDILNEDEFRGRFKDIRFAILEHGKPGEIGVYGKYAAFYELFDK